VPILPNPRHEKFAQAFAQGKSAYAAYKEAGYKPSFSHAVRMRDYEWVKERVAELQSEAAEHSVVTLKGLITKFSKLHEAGVKLNQISAAVAALTAQAKLAGFWVDRSENRGSHVVWTISDQPMSNEEWKAKYCKPAPVIEEQRTALPPTRIDISDKVRGSS
jgi:hypothetical protein